MFDETYSPNLIFSGYRESMRPRHLSWDANYANRKVIGGRRARMCRSRSHSRNRPRYR